MTSLHDSYEWLLTKRKGKNLFCDQWRSSIIGGGMAVVVGGLPSLLWWRSGEVEKKMGLMVKRGENGFGYLEEKVSLKKMVEESGLK